MDKLDLHVDHEFHGGYPTAEAARRAHDDLDLVRALQMYRAFYPTVSCVAMFKGNAEIGVIPNRTWGSMSTLPRHVGFTLNSDTPYGGFLLDLRVGPVVVELPPGLLLGAAMDLNQRWVADLGIPGPDAGKGGKHLFLPPDFGGEPPEGYYVCPSPTFRVLVGVRAIPEGGDLQVATDRLKAIRVHPLDETTPWPGLSWIDMTPNPQDTTPLRSICFSGPSPQVATHPCGGSSTSASMVRHSMVAGNRETSRKCNDVLSPPEDTFQ